MAPFYFQEGVIAAFPGDLWGDRPLTARYRMTVGHNLAGAFEMRRADVAHRMLRIR